MPIAILVIGNAALAAGLWSCSPAGPFPSWRPRPSSQSIVVGVPPLEQNALLYVAETRRFFDRRGLSVTVSDYETGMATVDALLNDKVQIAELAEFPFIRPALEGRPLQIIAVNDRFENDYLLVRKDRGISGPADLKGKRIGVIRGTILEFYLGRYLALHGIGLDQVTVVDTATPAQTDAALVDGELDAVVAFQPHVAAIQGQLGDGVLTWPVQSDQLVYGILAAKSDWLAQNGDAAGRFLQALADAERYLVAHPDDARAIVQRRLNLDADYLAAVWPLHQFSLSLDFSLIVALDDEARWMIDNGLARETTVPDFKSFIYLDGLAGIKPEAVNIIP